MKILMIGDVVGNPGRGILKRELKRLKAEKGAAAAIVNGIGTTNICGAVRTIPR